MFEWERTSPPPASPEVELESLPPLVDSPASPDPQTPADDDTDDGVRRLLPLPDLPGNAVGNGLLARTERVTEGVRFDDWTKIAHPTTASWSWSSSSGDGDGDDKDYRGVVDECSEAVVRHVRRAMNTCCMTHVANEVRGCFWRTNARGHGACVFGRYS